MSLSKQAFSGFSYIFGSSILSKVINLAGGIALARLLSPEDFGLIAMLYIIFEVSGFLITAGFGLVLVREKTVSEDDLSTVFWFNLIVSVILIFLIFILGNQIVRFYQRDELLILSRIMSLNLLFSASGIVQKSMFQRELKFKEIGIIEVVSGSLGLIIGIVLAYLDFGYLALSIKYIFVSFFASILLFIYNPWFPKSFIKIENFRNLFSFGSNVMVLGLVNTISRNFHQIIIGKFYSPASLGFFNQGNMLKDNVVNTVSTSIGQVTFPILSKLQDNKEQLKLGYTRILEISSYVIFPLVIVFFFIAEPLVVFLLGEKWKATTIFFQILLIGGSLNHIHGININVLKVYGKGRDYLMQGVIRNVFTLSGVLIGLKFGPIGIAYALVVSEVLQLFVNSYYSNKHISFTLKEQIKVMAPTVGINSLFVFLSLGYSHFFESNSLYFLFLYPFIFLVGYVWISNRFNLNPFVEIKNMLSSKFPTLAKLNL